ncbi:MAG: hypothetical protein REI11_05295 [Patulibacter sp.]|nr:hypothetical protein [Patulibacter sp.]
MRPLSRLLLLGAASALIAAPSAFAASTLTASVSPNKAGTVVQGNAVGFKLTGAFPDTPSDQTGNLQLQSIATKLPPALLFNPIPFSYCVGDPVAKTGFFATNTCPSSSKLGSATVIADGGTVGPITATTDLYFGAGYAVFARVRASQPAVIDQAVQAKLQSSGTNGYGLELYIPIPQELRQPIAGSAIYPTVKSVTATVSALTKSVKVKGTKGKVKVPLVGLGPCPSGGKLPFEMDVNYTDAGGLNTVKTDVAKSTASCKK